MSPAQLPSHWKMATIKDIASVKYGKSKPKEVGDIPVIGSGGIYGMTVKPLIEFPTLIIGRKGTAGMTWLQEQPCWASDTTFYLEWRIEEIDYRFVYHYLQWIPPSGEHARTTLPSLPRPDLENHPVPLPPLSEQRAIAQALRTVQETKEARQRELTLERERKAALVDYLFTYGTRGELRKQTEIGEIPESWEVCQLGNLTSLITKGSSPNWQGFEYRQNGIVFVRSQNVGWGILELTDIAHLSDDFNIKEKKSIIQKNDILINIVGASIGRAAIADDFVVGGNLNQAVSLVRLKPGNNPFFLMNFLLFEPGQVQIHKQKKDIARANLSLQDIRNILVPFPSLSEQEEIANTLSIYDAKITALEREVSLQDELFQTMLEELMTGRLSAIPLT